MLSVLHISSYFVLKADYAVDILILFYTLENNLREK